MTIGYASVRTSQPDYAFGFSDPLPRRCSRGTKFMKKIFSPSSKRCVPSALGSLQILQPGVAPALDEFTNADAASRFDGGQPLSLTLEGDANHHPGSFNRY